ncbi:MAG: hypothetical protein IPH03_16955 [Tetrasphaera sp.]|nr:hypothetical protein [Tetrasphaera sp.]
MPGHPVSGAAAPGASQGARTPGPESNPEKSFSVKLMVVLFKRGVPRMAR